MTRRLLDIEHPAIPALHDALVAAEFDDTNITERTGAIEVPTESTRTLPRLLLQTQNPTPLNILQRCFLFRVPVTRAELEHSLSGMSVDTLAEMGLVRLEGDTVKAEVALYPINNYFLAVDDPSTVHDTDDAVMPINTSTLAMIYATVRKPNGSALDLGCGCGALAIFAAEHSGEVYATDLNARAINFTAFNARLNGLRNVRAIAGPGYDPIGGKRFDQIVGNLPFAILPESRYTYRDSGEPLDTFAARMVKDAPKHLKEAGFCQFLCEWIEYEDEPWEQRIAKWTANSGCDTWVVAVEKNEPAKYAEKWLQETEPPGNDLELYRHWTSFYAQHRVQRIIRGWIMLRRRSGGANWFHTIEAPPTLGGAWGDNVVQAFAALDFLHSLKTPEDLLDNALILAHGVELLQFAHVEGGRWTGTHAQIVNKEGLRHMANIDQNAMLLLPRFDGQRPAKAVLQQFATEFGVPAERVIAPCLPLLQHLIERGILLPA